MKTVDVTIINKLGLHARAAAKLVTLASEFKSEITLARETQTANAKSIMGVMMLAAAKGTILKVSADGKDEAKAVEAIARLVNNRFGEEE